MEMGDKVRVTLVVSGKGGVGKSSVTALLGFFLTLLGKKVVILDLDSGISSISLLLKESDPVYTLGDVVQNNCTLESALIRSKYNKLDFIAASHKPSIDLTQSKLLEIIGQLGHYDFLLIDSPAGLGLNPAVSECTVDEALIVVNPELICLEGAKNISRILSERRIFNKRLIINKFSHKLWKQSMLEDLDELIDFVEAQLIGIIPFDLKFEAFHSDFLKVQTNRKLYKSYLNLANRYIGNSVPLLIR